MTKEEFEKQQFDETKASIREAVLAIIKEELEVVVSVDTRFMQTTVKVDLLLNGEKISSSSSYEV